MIPQKGANLKTVNEAVQDKLNTPYVTKRKWQNNMETCQKVYCAPQ